MSIAASSPALSAFAAAKINLALHVVGRRADGYHLLDSLVVFANIGDTVELAGEGAPALELVGPFAAGLDAGVDNLVSRAAAAHAARSGTMQYPRLRLVKRLPVASGLGGGSADAAATLRLLNGIGPSLADDALLAIAAGLGADVPMCLASRPCRATGIGESVAPFAGMPALPLVLVNPGVAVSTPAVFARLAHRDNDPLPQAVPAFADGTALTAWLARTRNDLEAPAIDVAPVIAKCLAAMTALPGCRLARMTGSGATVFGIFDNGEAAGQAAERLRRARPHWWVMPTMTVAA